MSKSDELAQATVRIVLSNGVGNGSGFHFIKPEIIVSNAHVVRGTVTAEAETGERWALEVLALSPPEEFDFAIMRATGAAFTSRRALVPDSTPIDLRGRHLLYGGYPHGVDPLLISHSEVTSPTKDKSFTFAAMIHGGNSGGPVVDAETLAAVGIVTRRRFLGDPEMLRVDQEMKGLQDYLRAVQAAGSVTIMGVNFGEFALQLSRIASLTNELIRKNSTTGIGLAYPIGPAVERCKALGLL